MQQCNTKDIFKLKPKCNTTQQCNRKISEKCSRGTSATQWNAMQQGKTKDILELKPKCNATQHNSAMGRYVRNALEEQVQRNATVQH